MIFNWTWVKSIFSFYFITVPYSNYTVKMASQSNSFFFPIKFLMKTLLSTPCSCSFSLCRGRNDTPELHSLAPIWHQMAAHHVMVHFSRHFLFFPIVIFIAHQRFCLLARQGRYMIFSFLLKSLWSYMTLLFSANLSLVGLADLASSSPHTRWDCWAPLERWSDASGGMHPYTQNA